MQPPDERAGPVSAGAELVAELERLAAEAAAAGDRLDEIARELAACRERLLQAAPAPAPSPPPAPGDRAPLEHIKA
jgi:hypothetical protein